MNQLPVRQHHKSGLPNTQTQTLQQERTGGASVDSNVRKQDGPLLPSSNRRNFSPGQKLAHCPLTVGFWLWDCVVLGIGGAMGPSRCRVVVRGGADTRMSGNDEYGYIEFCYPT